MSYYLLSCRTELLSTELPNWATIYWATELICSRNIFLEALLLFGNGKRLFINLLLFRNGNLLFIILLLFSNGNLLFIIFTVVQ